MEWVYIGVGWLFEECHSGRCHSGLHCQVFPPDIYFAEGDSFVIAEFVNYPEHYKFSSAIDYADGKGLLDGILV